MTPSQRKWAVLAAFLVLIGGGTVFFFRVTSRAEAPPAPKKPATIQDNPDHELKELTVQLQKKPGHFPVLMRMAQIEHDQGKLPEAEAHLREAVASEPARADVHLELGRVLYERGNQDEAIKETEQALTIDPKFVDALYNMGAIYANAGYTEKPRSYWERALAADPASDSGRKARDGLAKLRGGGSK